MRRRAFLSAAIAGAGMGQTACRYVPATSASSPATAADFELDEVSLSDLGNGLGQGKWTSERLVQLYLARIENIDKQASDKPASDKKAVDRNGPQLAAAAGHRAQAA